jgi:hypothetical protein
MDYISSIISLILFVVFVPGVVFTFPPRGSRMTVLAVHAVAFVVVNTLVMQYYWVNIKGYVESMMNYGDTCPNGYVPNPDKSGIKGEDCIPVGQPTYLPGQIAAVPESK